MEKRSLYILTALLIGIVGVYFYPRPTPVLTLGDASGALSPGTNVKM